MEPVDIEAIRQQAREQRQRRPTPPRTAWILEFEATLRELLVPRVQLFAAIMAAAGNPGLNDRRDALPQTWARAWLIGVYDSLTTLSSYTDENGASTTYPMTHPVFLAVSPAPLTFWTAAAQAKWQSVAVNDPLPEQSRITAGEIEAPCAFGKVATARYTADVDPRASAREFADVCDHRMLMLLCAHELTFPDRDLSRIEWDEDESFIMLEAEKARRQANRPPMTVPQLGRWMEGTRDADVVLPTLTGRHLAQALALTTIEPRRQRRRNWRNHWIDAGEKGWEISDGIFVRRDGSAFREIRNEPVEEFAPDFAYPPHAYSAYLGNRASRPIWMSRKEF